MLRRFTALLLIAPVISMAQESEEIPLVRKKIPAISLLPNGSQLKGVMLPRYDEKRNLVGVLKAKAMTLVNEEQIDGETVSLEFFNPDQSPRGRVDLKRASLYQTKGLLEAKEAVDIKSDRLTAHGTGLVYSFEKGEGFLLGPVTTIMQALNETTMNTPRTPLRATALLGMSLITQSLAAGPPPAMTAEERGALQSDAAPKASKAAEANAVTRQALQTDLADSETASKAAKTFLVQANIPVPAAADPAADAKPLEVKPGPDDTVIDCEGGMYFDADEGCLVFLKNVTVNDPQLDLSAKNELKVFFSKKPAKEKNPDKTEDPKEAGKKSKGAFGNVGANFGEVERIVATGAVRALQKKPDPGQPPVEASGAVFSYNVKSEQIIIHGGAPWVKRGGLITRAKTAEQTLRIDKDGVFDFDGPTQIILPVEELKKR